MQDKILISYRTKRIAKFEFNHALSVGKFSYVVPPQT